LKTASFAVADAAACPAKTGLAIATVALFATADAVAVPALTLDADTGALPAPVAVAVPALALTTVRAAKDQPSRYLEVPQMLIP
jgi:hypothetical protein